LFAGSLLIGLSLAVVAGPWFFPFDYQERVGPLFQPPGIAHWLGTDDLGRDVMVRLLYGGRISLVVGMAAALAAAGFGTAVGLCAGTAGGWLDSFLMRTTDIFLAIPALPILLILTSLDLERPLNFLKDFFGNPSWDLLSLVYGIRLVVVVALFNWMGTARLVRAQVLSVRQSDFVLAARAAGVGGFTIAFRHLLPHCWNLILISTATAVGSNILYEAVLGFLGLGIPPPTPSWGSMLQNARAYSHFRAPWLIYFPGLCIALTVICVNILTDYHQDRTDPKRQPFNG
jgi:peptide/nickel transport system permease protein